MTDLQRARRALTLAKRLAGRADGAPRLTWLRENYYLAQREFNVSADELRRGRFARARLPRVFTAARAYLDGCGARVGEASLEAFLSAESSEPFTERELGALLPAVRLELVARVAETARRAASETSGEEADAEFETLFTSLRLLADFDPSEVFARVNRVERILRRDPAGLYARLDETTRASYREAVARAAARKHITEEAAATDALANARAAQTHIGDALFAPVSQRGGALYIAANIAITAALTLLFARTYGRGAYAWLALVPISEVVKTGVDFVAAKLAKPRRLPRLELRGGVPAAGRTVAVISVLLSSAEAVAAAARLLEEYRLASRDCGENLIFGLLADLPEADAERAPGDAAILEAARSETARLNAAYGGGFCLFTRPRVYNPHDRRWSPYERKRGALLALARYLRGEAGGVAAQGDGARLRGVRYVLTLDADTRLCAGSARELIGAMLHPSARAVVDPVRRAVTRGYGILQPRVSTELGAATRSEFARAFSGDGGLDPYGGAPGDLYSALTGCGSFIGKGIFDVDAYLACLGGRFPENAVLSHDLLEGAYLRCGFAGDVELTDGAPASPDAHYARLHRWTRGDWQSAPWIFARGLTAMDRWKLADNLRRSLLPIAAAACLAYAGLTGAAGLAGLAILALVFGDVLRLLGGLPRLRDFGRRYFSYVPEGGGAPLARCFTRLLLLPADASVCAAAIVTALWRMLVTRRKMLEWTPAADMDARRGGLLRAYRTALPALILAGGVLCFTRYPPAAAFALVWLLSPLYFYALGRDAARQAETPRKTSDDAALREYAGRIWRYFDDFLRPEDNFLPPDNLRETPEATLTRKTSPTNIGLALTSCLAALDLGLATRERALFLIERTLGTLERLEKWRGHLYNWYDTATRAPMEPRYVSSVDSGNLAAALAALREGLAELGAGELARRAETLCRAMDFAPLYDAKRRLLRIGWDASAGTYSEGAYDLLASEAMLTSYLAVARGDVPRRHWRALSRAQLGKNGYRGCASWTGTMFEYLMPFLFLPCPRHSLLYENARFCVYIHERAKKRTRGVWGMSESAFYAPNLTRGYPYKAHGARELALKRGMERDAVAAPYASFLALMVSPRRALANLRRLETLGAAGEYGFREALDFTEERVRKNPEVVRSYMAHHLGMSLAAIDNHLCGGILRERFARDPEVRAHLELLSERVPRGGRTLKNPREVPERRARVPESARRGGEPGGEDHKIKLTQI